MIIFYSNFKLKALHMALANYYNILKTQMSKVFMYERNKCIYEYYTNICL